MAASEDRELDRAIRLGAIVVLVSLFVLMALAVLVSELVQDRDLDTTLILGLATSALTAATAWAGVEWRIRRRNGDGPDG